MSKQVILVKSESNTKKFAGKFAKNLEKRDVVELIGDLGSDKTFFVCSLAESLGAEGISSPSFVIKNKYLGGKFSILHFDLYRLDDPGLLIKELRESLSSADNLIIIEWAESIKDLLLDARYKIYFKVTGNNSRKLVIYR